MPEVWASVVSVASGSAAVLLAQMVGELYPPVWGAQGDPRHRSRRWSLTKLERTVKRTTKGKWRDLVVMLHPPTGEVYPAFLELREKRARSGLRITLEALYVILAEREAARRRAERKSRKKQRGSAL